MPYVGAPSAEAREFLYRDRVQRLGHQQWHCGGILIADQILGRPNPWAALYDPRRPSPKDFNQGGDTQSRVRALGDILPGEGGVLKVGKEDVAVLKEEGGTLHAFSASCTHKGCTLTWNNADRTWDCPCHGSIFSADGSIIHGPAVEPLAPRPLPLALTRIAPGATTPSLLCGTFDLA